MADLSTGGGNLTNNLDIAPGPNNSEIDAGVEQAAEVMQFAVDSVVRTGQGLTERILGSKLPPHSNLELLIGDYQEIVLARNTFHRIRNADSCKDEAVAIVSDLSARIEALPENSLRLGSTTRALLDGFIKTFPDNQPKRIIVHTVEGVWAREYGGPTQKLQEEFNDWTNMLNSVHPRFELFNKSDAVKSRAYTQPLLEKVTELTDCIAELARTARQHSIISRVGLTATTVSEEEQAKFIELVKEIPGKISELISFAQTQKEPLVEAAKIDARILLEREIEAERLAAEKASQAKEVPGPSENGNIQATQIAEAAAFRYALFKLEGRNADAVEQLRPIRSMTPGALGDLLSNLVDEQHLTAGDLRALKPSLRQDLLNARHGSDNNGIAEFELAKVQDPELIEILRHELHILGFNEPALDNLVTRLSIEEVDRLSAARKQLETRYDLKDVLPAVTAFVVSTDTHILAKAPEVIAERLIKDCKLWRRAVAQGIDPNLTSGVPELLQRVQPD